MKEEDSNPLEPVGDEPIEARIVAWVLGDASAFEAAELERLCAERPELLVFRHRMRALHGLLTEAEVAGPDEAWKLPAGKRAKIEELFGAMHPEPVATVMKPKRSFQPWLRQVLLASAACIVLAGGFYSVVAPMGGNHKVAANTGSTSTFNVSLPVPPQGKPRAIAAAPMPRAEGYASASPVLPELADLESQLPETGRLSGASGFGGGLGGGSGRARFRSAGEDSKALADNQSRIVPATPFPVTPATPSAVNRGDFDKALASGKMAQRPEGNIEVTREFNYSTERDAPELPAIAGNDSAGKASQPKEGDDTIVTGGLRSADGAVSRNSIDAVLNNPNLPAPKPAITAPRAVDEVADRGNSDATPVEPPADRFEVAPAIDAITSKAKEDRLAGERSKAAPQSAPALVGAKKAEALSLDGATADSFPQPQPAQAAAQGLGGNELAQREMLGREKAIAEGDRLLAEGRLAYANGDYEKAAANYKSALEKVPDAPALADRRESYTQHLVDGQVALAMKYRKGGKYEEAKGLLKDSLAKDPENFEAKREMDWLNDPIRTNPALTYEHTQNVEKVRKGLYMGEGAFNLGKYDDAQREFQETLRVDPSNIAARRWLERIASAQSDYYRAAYDHTRAELLTEVDRAWELSVPAEKDQSPAAAEDEKSHEYLVAKSEYETSSELLEAMKRKLDGKDGSVLSSDLAELSGSSATPGKAQANEPQTQAAAMEELKQAIRTQELKVAERGRILSTLAKAQSPATPAPVPTDETSAVEEPFSTFSLHVSDASFKLAKAALDRGERLSADQIRVEEFYNAFDYGDAAPAPGEAVACAIEQGGHPVLPQRNLVRVAMRVGSTGRAEGQPLNLTVLLDNSGSMEREDRSAGLKAAVGQLASLLKAGDSVTLAGFSRTPHLLADRLPGDQAAKLVALVDGLPSAGGTNLEEALKLAGELAVQRKNPAAQNRIVLLTDGAANLGNAKPEDLAEKIAALRQQGIAFDAAGIGAGGLNDRMLEALTRNGNGRYYIVNDPADADERFAKQLAGAFRPAAENVKVQVRFNPERVARYKLIGFEKHRLNKEDFHNDAVDAAEMAADEAGVALYQIETLPQGTGEIGEVSVRFKDSAAGQMVERSWTIPHDEKTPAFDQASPSLQLAGLSMLAAEKLRGGPLADATDFSSLAPQIARVRSYYGTSSRVGELVGMTGKLK